MASLENFIDIHGSAERTFFFPTHLQPLGFFAENLLRSAIGAPKMSLYGASYGTTVVSRKATCVWLCVESPNEQDVTESFHGFSSQTLGFTASSKIVA